MHERMHACRCCCSLMWPSPCVPAGVEIGFYTGCVQMWRRLQAHDPTIIPERAAKGVALLEELLASFPLEDATDERIQGLMEKIQGRFKAVASLMGNLQDYFPRGDNHGTGTPSLASMRY